MTAQAKEKIKKMAAKIRQETDSPIILIPGIFEIFHIGHMRLIDYASVIGGYIVVGIIEREDRKSFFSANNRKKVLENINHIDKVIVAGDDYLELVRELRPDFILKGEEKRGISNNEMSILHEYGGELIFHSGEYILDASNLLSQDMDRENNQENLLNIQSYIKRHKIDISALITIIKKFKNHHVGVIGDIIIDQYVQCNVIGMSREDETIVVSPDAKKSFVGGAGIVAAHAKSLGASTSFFSAVGNDEAGQYCEQHLTDIGLAGYIIKDKSRKTINKTRYRSKNKTLLRVNEITSHDLEENFCDEIYRAIEKNIKKLDILVFCDFSYGVLPQSLIDRLTELGRKHGVFMVADSQSSSQIGDIWRFKNMDLVTPTEFELRAAGNMQKPSLLTLVNKYYEQTEAKNVIVTLAENGAFIHNRTVDANDFLTDQIASMVKNPVDVAGAGDVFMLVSALSLFSGATIWQAAYIASVAASIQVGQLGNIPLQYDILLSRLMTMNHDMASG